MKADSRERILVFRTGQLGDMIASLPAMWATRRQWPDARLTLLCDVHRDQNYVLGSEIFQGAGLFDNFEHYKVIKPGENYILAALKKVKLLARIRAGGYKTLVYLAPSIRPRTHVERDRHFFRLCGIKTFYGMNYFLPVPTKDSPRPVPSPGHEADLLLARLKADGITVPRPGKGSLDLQLGAKEAHEVNRWLRRLRHDSGKTWIGVGPGSKMPAKRWPVERFEKVVGRLIEGFNIWPVVFGGKEDRAIGEDLLQSWGRGFNAAGELNVRAAASALGRCALFLGNDTGTMHLAAAAGTPCVAVFSSRDWPGAWYPYGVERRVFRSQIECERCYLVECIERQNECLKRINTDEVLNACREILSARPNIMSERTSRCFKELSQ